MVLVLHSVLLITGTGPDLKHLCSLDFYPFFFKEKTIELIPLSSDIFVKFIQLKQKQSRSSEVNTGSFMGFIGERRAYRTVELPEFQGLHPHLKHHNFHCISTSTIILHTEIPRKDLFENGVGRVQMLTILFEIFLLWNRIKLSRTVWYHMLAR